MFLIKKYLYLQIKNLNFYSKKNQMRINNCALKIIQISVVAAHKQLNYYKIVYLVFKHLVYRNKY